MYNSDGIREQALLRASLSLDGGQPRKNFMSAVESLEPNVPWDFGFLRARTAGYTALKHPRAADAQADLLDYLDAESGGIESARPQRVAAAAK